MSGLVPAHLDDYEVIRELGRGGMGVVLLARQKSLDRLVALKVLNAEHKDAGALIKRFRREAMSLVRLKHPNLVHLYDSRMEGSHPYIVMELIEGESTLKDRIETGKYSHEDALALALEVVSAVAYLHEQGIVHRDLKPANVLMDRQGSARLADLGVARDMDPNSTRVTADGQILGTITYMAPEMLYGQPADETADVYTLGLILFELLERKLVFGGRPPLIAPFERASRGLPSLMDHWPEAPRALDRLIARCVAREKSDRPKDAREVLVELSKIVDAYLDKGFGQTEVIRLQIEKYTGPHFVPRDKARSGSTRRHRTITAVPDIATIRDRVWLIAVLLIPCTAGVVLAIGWWLTGSGHRSSRPVLAESAPAAPSPVATDCSSARSRLTATVESVFGEDGGHMVKILDRFRSYFKAAASPGAFRDAVTVVLGRTDIGRLEEDLRAACPIVTPREQGTSVDHAVLSQLASLEVLDELAISMGESPVFQRELYRLRGPFASMSELAPMRTKALFGYYPPATFKGPEEAEWEWTLPALPDGDAELTFVVNDLDPKAILEVTVNRIVRLNYRNRSGFAGEQTYDVPPALIAGEVRAALHLTPGGLFPKFTVLTRRIPRSALRSGLNRLQLRFVLLPGPLKLRTGKSWAVSSKLTYGTVWHAYLAFRETSKGQSTR